MRDCLRARLADVVANNRTIIAVTRNLGFFTNGYNYLIQLIPLLIVAPMYMRGEVEFGVVTQSAMAFSAVLGGFSLIVTQFETLSTFAAVTERLNTIAGAIEQARAPATSAIEIVGGRRPGGLRGTHALDAEGAPSALRDLSLTVPHGSSLLITGPNAAAKTALFLATAGVWEDGKGRIIRPGPDRIRFVPQRPLAIRCTLREQLLVTSPGRTFADAADPRRVLDKVGLEPVVDRVGGLDVEHDWANALSPGEQHLVAIARVLLIRPRFVFLDQVAEALEPGPGRAPLSACSPRRRSPTSASAKILTRSSLPRPGAGTPRRGPMAIRDGQGCLPRLIFDRVPGSEDDRDQLSRTPA